MCLTKDGRLIITCRNICIRHERQQRSRTITSQDEQNTPTGDDHESIQMTRFQSSQPNIARYADNEGATGPKENVYSSVDDFPMPACGSGDAYTEVNSEMCPLQPHPHSSGQLELNNTLPGSEYELVRDLNRNENELTLTVAEQEKYPECSFAMPHQIHQATYDRVTSSTLSNGDRRPITSSSSIQEKYQRSSDFINGSQNNEQNDLDEKSAYDTLNLHDVNETRRNSAVHISTSVSPSSSSTTRASSSDLTSIVPTSMMRTGPSTSDYDNLRRPDVEDYIGY